MDFDVMRMEVARLKAFEARIEPLLEALLKNPPGSSEAIAEDVKQAMGVLRDVAPKLHAQEQDVEEALAKIAALGSKFDELKSAVDVLGAVVPDLAGVKAVVDRIAPMVDKLEEIVADYEKLKVADEPGIAPVGAALEPQASS